MKQLAMCIEGERERKRCLPRREIKILALVAGSLQYSLAAAGNSASWINLSIIESRRLPLALSSSRFHFLFLLDRALNHALNNCARDSTELLIIVVGLMIKMSITFAGLKFYSRRATPLIIYQTENMLRRKPTSFISQR